MDADQPFKELFEKAGIEGAGEPPPPPAAPPPPALRAVVLGYEKRSGNKVVTSVRDVPPELREETLAAIKKALGTGGSLSGDLLVVQGDHRAALAAWFEARGVRVRGQRA